jgi:hypothetical protein
MDWAEIVRACGQFVKDNGFAASVTFALLLVAYRLGTRFLDGVAKPASEQILEMAAGVKEGHDRFIDSTISSQEKIDECIEKQSVTLGELKDQSVTHTKILECHSQLLGQIHENTKPAVTPKRRK